FNVTNILIKIIIIIIIITNFTYKLITTDF
uniref:Uncharacterized protein n=1 Tax=Amphimedon queenslandica TaxID=400682 RepID=A0A1X7TP46_AMPQE